MKLDNNINISYFHSTHGHLSSRLLTNNQISIFELISFHVELCFLLVEVVTSELQEFSASFLESHKFRHKKSVQKIDNLDKTIHQTAENIATLIQCKSMSQRILILCQLHLALGQQQCASIFTSTASPSTSSQQFATSILFRLHQF